MAEFRFDDREERDLEWENLQGPVPMDLIDPEFPAHPTRELPGAASEILPREESEALAREAGARIPPETEAELPAADPNATLADGAASLADGTTWFSANQAVNDDFARIRAEMEAEDEAEKQRKLAAEQEEAAQRARLEQWMANARARLMKADADLTGPAGRIRLRKESSPSLYRLAEMQKTMDLSGEPTVPDGTRSLLTAPAPDPMATISVPADQFLKTDPATTVGPAMGFPPLRPYPADIPAAPAPAAGPAPEAPAADPTQPAFPIHPFVKPPGSSNPQTTKFPSQKIPVQPNAAQSYPAQQFPAQSFPPQPVPQAPAAFSVPTVITGAQGWPTPGTEAAPPAAYERSFAFPPDQEAPAAYDAPEAHQARESTEFRPLTREEALTRKVAKLRMAAETGDNTLVRSPLLDEEGNGRALNFAIAAMVLVAILVLGLGLFAATQAGLFDGMENRIPFLKPKVAGGLSAPAGQADRAIAKHAPEAALPEHSPEVVEAPPIEAAPAPSPAVDAAPAVAAAPAIAAAPNGSAAKRVASAPEARPSRNNPVPSRAARSASRPAQPAGAPGAKAAAKSRKGQAQSFPPSAAPEEEIPAYARPRASGAAQTENQLRSAVEAAANMEKDDLRELYNRYALGFPGLSGEVVVGLTVDPSGRILEATVVSSTTGVTTFDQDLVRKVVLWRLRSFPESRPKFISVPFLFPMQGH